MFLITFDEHGGTYDHVPPPMVPAPHTGGALGQMGFGFQRLNDLAGDVFVQLRDS